MADKLADGGAFSEGLQLQVPDLNLLQASDAADLDIRSDMYLGPPPSLARPPKRVSNITWLQTAAPER